MMEFLCPFYVHFYFYSKRKEPAKQIDLYGMGDFGKSILNPSVFPGKGWGHIEANWDK